MRVRLEAKGTMQGLKMGSDMLLLIVPEDNKPRTDHIEVFAELDPENPELGLVFYVDRDD